MNSGQNRPSRSGKFAKKKIKKKRSKNQTEKKTKEEDELPDPETTPKTKQNFQTGITRFFETASRRSIPHAVIPNNEEVIVMAE